MKPVVVSSPASGKLRHIHSNNSNSHLHGGSSNNSNHRPGLSDRPFIQILVGVLVIYLTVTVLTYVKISSDHVKPASLLVVPVKDSMAALRKAAEVTSLNKNNIVADADPEYTIYNIQHKFPIHVGDFNDTEEIIHPGLAMVANPVAIPPELPRTMKVPKFFNDAFARYYYPDGSGDIRKFLGNNGERLITPEEASKIGSFDPVSGQPTIYCSVATYRDPECVGTIEDMYARAKYPTRIRVALTDQHVVPRGGDNTYKLDNPYMEEPICSKPAKPCTEDPEQALCKYAHLIDHLDVDAPLAVGPVFARHLGHRHYRGEYFAMQIDSHVRFVEHWDELIVRQWKQAGNEMAVLTTYLSDIINSIDPVTHAGIHPGRPIMCASDYEGSGHYKHLRHGQQPEGTPGITGQPTLHPFWAAGFSFARGHFVIQVPYDQYLPMVFQGEEISLGLRGFTYGYDYYAPEKSVAYHMYGINENAEKRKKVPLFWENSKIYVGVGMKAMKRLNRIIGVITDESEAKQAKNGSPLFLQPGALTPEKLSQMIAQANGIDYDHDQSDPNWWPQNEKEKYGLGKVRQPEKFYRTFGIHTETQTVEKHLCRFVGAPMMRVFMPALRANKMGLDYDKITYEFKDPAPNEE